jgi:repressor LexA
MLTDNDKRAFAFIRNWIIRHGESPTLREINLVTGKSSPRSASLLIERLVEAGLIKKVGRKFKLIDGASDSSSVSTVNVPLVGSVACGVPILAEENVETYIPVSTAWAKRGAKYFLLRAVGTSMNKAGIDDGSIVLVRQQNSAQNGDKVVALINDEATVKIFEKTSNAVILRPKSTDPKHKPIVLTDNCEIQGVVVTVLPPDLH